MCRLMAYVGEEQLIYDLLYQPKDSLISQALKAKESEYITNGDGFGLGWYLPHRPNNPGVFRSIQPAWNDSNLRNISRSLISRCFMAHVRAATAGNVAINNCHPFRSENMLMMHNGHVGHFADIKRQLRSQLNDEHYAWLEGQTDTEHLFALFQQNLGAQKNKCPEIWLNTLSNTFNQINDMQSEMGVGEDPSHINAVITNGESILAMRYTSDANSPAPSLYFSTRAIDLSQEDWLTENDNPNGLLIASEKLDQNAKHWQSIETNQALLFSPESGIQLKTIPL